YLNQLIVRLGKMHIELFKKLGIDLEEERKKIDINSIQDLINLVKEGDKVLFKRTEDIKKIENLIEKLGVLVMFAHLVEEDNFTKVIYDTNNPQQYERGWNILYKKKSSGTRDKETKEQKVNNSCADLPCSLLTGSNMGGKTYYLRSSLYIQLCAQSFGYVPAKGDVNMHIYDGIVYLDRASTDSANNLSAFGSEIKLWKEALKVVEKKKGRVFIFTDEAFSTTSPEDQSKLLKAITLYLNGQNARILMATHSEEFIEYGELQKQIGVYHFGTGIGDNGDITFTHKLKEGKDNSHALEVARRMELGNNIVETAEVYFADQNVSKVSSEKREYPEILEYDEHTREKLKGLKSSFLAFSPRSNELIFRQEEQKRRNSTKIIKYLDWRFEPEEGGRYSGSYSREEKKYEERKPVDTIFSAFSKDRDLIYYGARDLLNSMGKHINFDSILNDTIKMMFFSNYSPSSEDIKERQKLMEQIMNADKFQYYNSLFGSVNHFLWLSRFDNFDEKYFLEFNKSILEKAYKNDLKRSNFYSNKEVLPVFLEVYIRILSLSQKLGDDSKIIGKALEKLTNLKEIFEEVNGIYITLENDHNQDREFSKNNLELSQEEKEGILTERRNKGIKILNEIREVIKSVAENYNISVGEFDSIGVVVRKAIILIHEEIFDQIKPFSIFDVNHDIVNEELKPIERFLNTDDYNFYGDNSVHGTIVMLSLIDGNNYLETLINELRSFDSVYFHSIANYLEEIFEYYTEGINTGQDILANIKNYMDDVNSNNRYGTGLSSYGNRESNADFETESMISKEVLKIFTIFCIAHAMKNQGYAKVDFNSKGDLTFTNLWNMNQPKKEQIPNTTSFGDDNKIQLITGTNMSGKTHYMKSLIFAILSAHATGYAPAEAATMPIFDKVLYIDRVDYSVDRTLSSFGNEIEYWKKLIGNIEKGQNVFICVDEAFSTTSPKYQSALTYAIAEYILAKGQYLAIASHNHDFIEVFANTNDGNIETFHFKTHVDDEGKISFDYNLEKGHEKSNAIMVADKLGFPDEILELAKLM
ncbi:MAG: hypothetical protein PHO80_05070, partial [Candidatus Gracilibacteria bacterium]|nr:hypothetical protein [Candidatus Gracilibacteria bacterium]